MLLFMTARAQLVEELIRPALAKGYFVLCDRYTFSTVVYQGHAGGLSPDEIWSVNRVATGGLVPHLTLLFDMPVDAAIARIGERELDRMESRGREYMERVRKGFLKEAERWPRGVEIVDASPDSDTVFESVRLWLEKTISESPS
jgi:dTMP kinase